MREHPLVTYASRTGTSLTKIAAKAGVSRMTLHRLIRGEQNATVNLLERVSAATDFEVPVTAFLRAPSQANEAAA